MREQDYMQRQSADRLSRQEFLPGYSGITIRKEISGKKHLDKNGKMLIMENYIVKDGKKLRYGYTTGSCAAAAAKAAAVMLLTQQELSQIDLLTPKGILLHLDLIDVQKDEKSVSCAVKKDAGDDSDVTDGALIYARAQRLEPADFGIRQDPRIQICAGIGIGRVTKAGLDQPVGAYAINSGPRMQIQKAVSAVMRQQGFLGKIRITLSVPDGERLAEKTFNPKLGIVGGISIIGTSGIVEPMSEDALLSSIALELHVKAAAGEKHLILTPGNYGQDFIKDTLQISLDHAAACSNFIGDAFTLAWGEGFREILLIGHIGKLVKLGAGAWNTHSKYGDGRMEELSRCAREAGFFAFARDVLDCATTEDAVARMQALGIKEPIMRVLLAHIRRTLKRWKIKQGIPRTDGCTEVLLFTRQHGMIASTEGAERILEHVRADSQG